MLFWSYGIDNPTWIWNECLFANVRSHPRCSFPVNVLAQFSDSHWNRLKEQILLDPTLIELDLIYRFAISKETLKKVMSKIKKLFEEIRLTKPYFRILAGFSDDDEVLKELCLSDYDIPKIIESFVIEDFLLDLTKDDFSESRVAEIVMKICHIEKLEVRLGSKKDSWKIMEDIFGSSAEHFVGVKTLVIKSSYWNLRQLLNLSAKCQKKPMFRELRLQFQAPTEFSFKELDIEIPKTAEESNCILMLEGVNLDHLQAQAAASFCLRFFAYRSFQSLMIDFLDKSVDFWQDFNKLPMSRTLSALLIDSDLIDSPMSLPMLQEATVFASSFVTGIRHGLVGGNLRWLSTKLNFVNVKTFNEAVTNLSGLHTLHLTYEALEWEESTKDFVISFGETIALICEKLQLSNLSIHPLLRNSVKIWNSTLLEKISLCKKLTKLSICWLELEQRSLFFELSKENENLESCTLLPESSSRHSFEDERKLCLKVLLENLNVSFLALGTRFYEMKEEEEKHFALAMEKNTSLVSLETIYGQSSVSLEMDRFSNALLRNKKAFFERRNFELMKAFKFYGKQRNGAIFDSNCVHVVSEFVLADIKTNYEPFLEFQ